MTALAPITEPGFDLRTLVDRATSILANARSAADVLEAREVAGFAYDIAKRAARLQRAKDAHDVLIGAAHRAQAHALEIEARAKHRLADEYDAAQERGEVVGAHNGAMKRVPKENAIIPATSGQLGLSRKDIHEARQIRDAERADPGIVRRTLDERLARGEEPTRAALRKMVVDAAMRGLRGGTGRKRAVNPHHKPNPAFDAVAAIDGCCTRIVDQFDAHGSEFILSGCVDQPMLERSIAKMIRGRDVLNILMEAANAR
jgi:hypothetical protein